MKAGMKDRNFLTTSVRSVDAEKYRITHVVNTKTLDRYGTVVLPKGADVENFKKNPVVLWLHGHDMSITQVPVAKCVELTVGEDAIEVTTEFNPNDALSMRIFNAYKDGFMNAWSIGFMPKTFEEITPVNYEEIKTKYNLQNLKLTQKDFEDNEFWGLWVISEWELLEYSCVPVPGNPEALSDEDCEKFSSELVARGIMEDEEVRRINFRELLKKKTEKKEGETPAEAAPVEATKPAEAEAAATVEKGVEATPAPAAEVTPAPAEVAKVAEAAASDVSTPEGQGKTENVAEPTELEILKAEVVAVRGENETLKATVSELSRSNADLMARLETLEADVKAMKEPSQEVKELREQLATVKKAVDVDNIETVRQVAQHKATTGGNAESFFSNLLGKK